MDDQVIWNVLFDAALTDFPNPPAGTRQVRTTLEAKPAPAATTTTPAAAPAAAGAAR